MITIRIGDTVRNLEDVRNIDESWINQQINRRREDGLSVCVRISIKEGSFNIALSSSGCASSGGGGRLPNREEQTVFDLWEKVGMNKTDFHGGNLVAFLKQMRSII